MHTLSEYTCGVVRLHRVYLYDLSYGVEKRKLREVERGRERKTDLRGSNQPRRKLRV